MFRSPDGYAVGQPVALFALTTLAIAIAWWWLGAPVALPPSPLAPGEKLYCVSYAPFRDAQNPLDPTTIVSPAQIDEDLALLSHYTDCVRTYAIENGLDKVPEIAQRYGIKVLFGLWVGNNPDRNREEIATGVALARKYPDVISAIVVGNEVLLRGEMSATDLGAAIRQVKSQVSQPVTYADVWEFWLRYAELQSAVDFVTIHILPYWEDFPLPAAMAAAHVDAIRKQVAAAIPNKEIVIGETGWPSAGRMREGARPSPSNQARVIEDTLALGKRENFHVNVIEAFDQPWKRAIEGATGAYWGIFDRATGALKFPLGGAVSDHPHWVVQALAGIVLAAMAFAAAWAGGDEKSAAALSVACHCGAGLSPRRPVRLDARDRSGREFHRHRLGAFAGVCGRRGGGAGGLRRRLRRRPRAADVCVAARPPRRAAHRARRRARRNFHGAGSARGRGCARPGVRPALSRRCLRAADCRHGSVSGAALGNRAADRTAGGRRDRGRRHLDGIGRLHRAQ